MKTIEVTFRSDRGDEFQVNLEFGYDPNGKLYGVAVPTNIVTTYGQLLKLTYTFELAGKTCTVRFEKDRNYHVLEVDRGNLSVEGGG